MMKGIMRTMALGFGDAPSPLRPQSGAVAAAAWQRLAFAAVGVAAAALVLARQINFGPGLTPDSSTYVSVARSLLEGEGFVSYYGHLKLFPPLFPLVVAAGGAFGVDAIAVAAWLNAAAFGATVWIAGDWLRRRGAPPLLSIGVAVACTLSLPMARVVSYVWSESLFVLLVMASLSLLDRHTVTGGRRALLLAAVCAGLCCLTRYVGFALVASSALVLMVAGHGPVYARLRRLAVYAAVALAPIGLWMARSWVLFGAPVGAGEAARWPSALDALDVGVTQVLSWVVGPSLFWRLGLWGDAEALSTPAHTGLKLAALVAGAGLFAGALARRPGAWRAVGACGCFTVCYFAMLAVALPLRGLFPEPRYLAPAHLPLLLTAALGVNAMLAGGLRGRRSRRWAGRLVGVGLALWLAQWLNANRIDIAQWLAAGSDGYGAKRWQTSEAASHLRAADLAGSKIFTNDHAAVYLLAGLDAGGARVFAHGRCGAEETCLFNVSDAAAVSNYRSVGGSAHIVWFHAPRLAHELGLEAMVSAYAPMKAVAVFADGIVFQLGAPGAAGRQSRSRTHFQHLAGRASRFHRVPLAQCGPAALPSAAVGEFVEGRAAGVGDHHAPHAAVQSPFDECAEGLHHLVPKTDVRTDQRLLPG